MPVIPGETYGLHHVRLGALTADMVETVANMVANELPAQPTAYEPAQYFKKPTKAEVTIDWEKQSAEEIEALVNACNPKYNGAFTSIRGMEMSILEVAFANITDPPANTAPGTVIYADALYGLIVACADGKFVKITTVCMPEGYFSGGKLFGLGFGVGARFA